MEEKDTNKAARKRLRHALAVSAGVLNPADYPDWDTPEKTSAWVRASRQADEEASRKKLSTVVETEPQQPVRDD
jgi:hypothetical protein